MDAKIINVIRDLTRDDCIEVLMQYGIQVYADEDNATLREAIEVNYLDNTISGHDILEMTQYSPLCG